MKNEIEKAMGAIQPFAERMTVPQYGALQQVKTAYATAVAVQEPRSITKVLNNVVEEARLAGTDFFYHWKVTDKNGKKVPVEGPSIDLAMCLARNYGNCVIDVEADETATHFMIKGVFIDLESGLTVPRLFRQRKSQRMGSKMEIDRQEDIVFQIGQSKAQRNAIVKAMPAWIISRAIDEAKKAATAEFENLAESRAAAVEYFKSNYGIDQDRMEKAMGKKADKWSKFDLAELKGTITAIRENRIDAAEAFPPTDAPEKTKTEKTPGPIRDLKKEKQETDAAGSPGPPATDPDEKKDKKTIEPPADDQVLVFNGQEMTADEIWEKEFKNLGSGYQLKVKSHIEFIKTAPEGLQQQLREKWYRLQKIGRIKAEHDFPLDRQKQTTLFTDEESDDFQEKAEIEARAKHIKTVYDGKYQEVMLGLNISSKYDLEELSLDLLDEILDRCQKMDGDH